MNWEKIDCPAGLGVGDNKKQFKMARKNNSTGSLSKQAKHDIAYDHLLKMVSLGEVEGSALFTDVGDSYALGDWSIKVGNTEYDTEEHIECIRGAMCMIQQHYIVDRCQMLNRVHKVTGEKKSFYVGVKKVAPKVFMWKIGIPGPDFDVEKVMGQSMTLV